MSLQLSQTKWKWGQALEPITRPIADPFKTLPQIKGHAVEWIADIRNAPGGSKWIWLETRFSKSELLIRVKAAVTDLFTLYLEKNSAEDSLQGIVGGIYLDSSRREIEDPIVERLLIFQLPFAKEIYFDILKMLLSLKECPLKEPPKEYPLTLQPVDTRQKKKDHQYFISFGWVENDKLCFVVKHLFSVTAFKLEYEVNSTSAKENTLLHAELFAIEDHNIDDCTCSRKRKITSTIEFKLAAFEKPKLEWIRVWGPHDTQFFNEHELTISTSHAGD